MKNVFFLFVICGSVWAVTYSLMRKPDVQIGQVLFAPKDSVDITSIERFAREHGGTITKVARVLPLWQMDFSPEIPGERLDEAIRNCNLTQFWQLYNVDREQVFTMCDALYTTGLVRYAQPNFRYYIAYTPNDPYFIDDGDYRPGYGADQYGFFIVNATAGWNITRGSRNVKLCVLDSGVDVDHPDLAQNIWINPGEDIDHDGELYDYSDRNGIDDDSNGYVDDLFGYDFVGGNTGESFTTEPDQEDWNPDIHYSGNDGWGEPDPSCGNGTGMIFMPADVGVAHGTHCAGVAGAVMDNAYMFAGACGTVSIVPVRIMNPEGSGTSVDMVKGVEYTVAIRADVASMSFGGLFGMVDSALVNACRYAYLNGVTLVAASGNEGSSTVSSPASSPYTLAVGSVNSARGRSYFSNYGTTLDVLAAGGDAIMSGWEMVYTEVIWSTWVVSVAEANTTSYSPGDHKADGMAGTSMACPQAAGLAALVKSILPDAPPDTVFDIIRQTAQDIGPAGRDNETGYGIIDFGSALTRASASVWETNESFKHAFVQMVPNPANSSAKIVLSLPTPVETEISVFDIGGRKVFSIPSRRYTVGNHCLSIPKTLETGVYFVRMSGDIQENRMFAIVE